MRPLFTIHGGEYLVGSHIEQKYPNVNVWVPSQDTGVDLLVSDRRNRRTVSLQVKFSKDYLPAFKGPMGPVFQRGLRACGWWTIDQSKLRASPADFWVFVLLGFARRTEDFVVVPPRELWRHLRFIHGSSQKKIQSHLWVTEKRRCWETRGLRHKDELRIADGMYGVPKREFTKWLNEWGPVARLNK